MNNKLLALLFITPLLVFTLYSTSYSKSNYAPPNQTGAIGEPSCGLSGGATNSCHFSPNCGNQISTFGNVNFDLQLTANGVTVDHNFKYIPNTSYEMVFTILNPSARGGFSFTVIDDQGNHKGSLSVASGAEAEISNTNSNYVGHTNTLGLSGWTFTWTAPAAGTGTVNFYASANKGNNDFPQPNQCNDLIIPFKMIIAENTSVAIANLSLENEVSIKNNPIFNNTITLDIFVKEPKTYTISVYNLSGKIVAQKEVVFHNGIQNLEIGLEQKGLFILHIKTNKNERSTYKILN